MYNAPWGSKKENIDRSTERRQPGTVSYCSAFPALCRCQFAEAVRTSVQMSGFTSGNESATESQHEPGLEDHNRCTS